MIARMIILTILIGGGLWTWSVLYTKKYSKPFPWFRILSFIAVVAMLLWVGSCVATQKNAQAEVKPEAYPVAGEGLVTKDGLRVWLDPYRTYTRSYGCGSVRYVFVELTNIVFVDSSKIKNAEHEAWLKMPAGKYIVYPSEGCEKAYFRWWQ